MQENIFITSSEKAEIASLIDRKGDSFTIWIGNIEMPVHISKDGKQQRCYVVCNATSNVIYNSLTGYMKVTRQDLLSGSRREPPLPLIDSSGFRDSMGHEIDF